MCGMRLSMWPRSQAKAQVCCALRSRWLSWPKSQTRRRGLAACSDAVSRWYETWSYFTNFCEHSWTEKDCVFVWECKRKDAQCDVRSRRVKPEKLEVTVLWNEVEGLLRESCHFFFEGEVMLNCLSTPFLLAVTDAPANVMFLFETQHRRLRLLAHENTKNDQWHCGGRCLFRHRTDDAGVKPPQTRTEEDRAELAALWAAVSKMASSLMWRTGQKIEVPLQQIKEVPAMMQQETVEGMGEMPEIIVVSDAVEGISQRDPVQQRTPSRLRMCLNFGKRQPMWWSWSRVNACNSRLSMRQRPRCWKRPSRQWGRSHMNECNSEPPNRLRICLNLREEDRRGGDVSPTWTRATAIFSHRSRETASAFASQMDWERAMRRVEKLRERHDHPARFWEGICWTDSVYSFRVVRLSSHRQSSTGSVVVTATCATSQLSQITCKTKQNLTYSHHLSGNIHVCLWWKNGVAFIQERMFNYIESNWFYLHDFQSNKIDYSWYGLHWTMVHVKYFYWNHRDSWPIEQ